MYEIKIEQTIPVTNAVPTIRIDIYMAGDVAQARQVCREFCRQGFCVHIEQVDYIYTGGEESGFKVGLLNYPRFPSNLAELSNQAFTLGNMLRERLCQDSFLIVTPDTTHWYSIRTTKDYSK